MCQKLDSQRVTLKLPQAFYPSFKELLDSPTHEGAKILASTEAMQEDLCKKLYNYAVLENKFNKI